MSFISYAQNFEDVMLWRALKHVENGFYIDVGANDPSIDSVTKAFYERGWNGINIEPLPSHHSDLQLERLRDINLQCAAGAVHGVIDLWEFDIRGWATADKSVVALHAENGHEGVLHKVPVLPLSEICATYVESEIHFLKIDVEGFEKSVIEGMDFSLFRPWVLIVEATRPNSTVEVHGEWENIVLSNNYLLAYTDGLNRFYVANEHSELLAALHYPPNVLDGFALSADHFFSRLAGSKAEQAEAKVQQAEAKVQQAEAKVQQAEAKAEQAEAKAEQAEAKAEQAEVALIAMQNSSSWRLTAPLRMVARTVKDIFCLTNMLKPKGKHKIMLLLAHAKLYVNRRPKLRRIAFAVLARFPALGGRIWRATMAASSAQRAYPPIATELANLPPRARRIYADLKTAQHNHSKEKS